MVYQPLVSIAMPVHNAAETLNRAVGSVIGQSYSRWELILIDDGSTDETGHIAANFRDSRIRLVSDNRKLGLAARLNQALDICHGEYFARLDADDIAYPERLQRQVEFLQQHVEIDLLGTGAVVFGNDGTAVGVFPLRQTHDEICRNPWSGFYLAHTTWMGRTQWFRKHRYRNEMRKAVWTTRRKKDADDPRFGPGHERLFVHLKDPFRSRKDELKSKLLAESK